MTDYNDNLHKNSKASAYENARDLRKTPTKAEEKLWQALRDNQVSNLKFRRQHAFDNYILDFYCHKMKLAIEVDGEVHNSPEVAIYDEARTKILNENGITVLRFTNDEVENDIEKVIKKIEDWFTENDFVELALLPAESEEAITGIDKNNIAVAGTKAPLLQERGWGEVNNRIDKLFSEKQKNILNVYCTAGYPHLNSTLEVMHALQANGADMVEIGMPYSDPLADGPVIQQSNMVALENGMSIPLLFEQLKNMRNTIHLPVILMGYMNPVLQFGIEKFCTTAAAAGVDGIILPDLPIYEFETVYKQLFEKHHLHFIFLVTPETSVERIRKIDSLSSGFIYAVSSSSTTGNNKDIALQGSYFKKLQAMQLKNPVLVGFGISNRRTFETACQYSNGAIIGSAFISALENTDDIGHSTKEFLNTIR